MSRVVDPNSPGKIRNQLRRTSAELLRHLSQKSELDDEAKDMAALLVFCLREIYEGIESSAESWEKRDYWVKAEQLRQRWSWSQDAANKLEKLIRSESWNTLPVTMAGLFEHFSDIKVTKFTRKPIMWRGAHARLVEEFES
jgi:hypothetical protein